MVVILPKSPNGLPELEKELTLENLNDWLGRLLEKQVSVYFPRFSLNSGCVLAETLKSMGMIDAFSAPPADFSGIDGQKDLAIDQVVHKAVAGVTERGSDPSGPGTPAAEENVSFADTEFAADHSFLFVIRDKQSGAILFMGRVTNPAKSARKEQ
jgi:serpin B